MQKIPTVFRRNLTNRKHVTHDVNPECQWVLDGEGVATRKYDGTCVFLDVVGIWWARREVKPDKTIPPNFVEVVFDEVTGKRQGWVPIEESGWYRFFKEAVGSGSHGMSSGTYELCGPRINGNPEGYSRHRLTRHEWAQAIELPETLSYYDCAVAVLELEVKGREGIVWHHPDGRMAKLKGVDIPESMETLHMIYTVKNNVD